MVVTQSTFRILTLNLLSLSAALPEAIFITRNGMPTSDPPWIEKPNPSSSFCISTTYTWSSSSCWGLYSSSSANGNSSLATYNNMHRGTAVVTGHKWPLCTGDRCTQVDYNMGSHVGTILNGYFRLVLLYCINRMKYSRLSLIGTPGDRRNLFVLSGIRNNRSHLHGFVQTREIKPCTPYPCSH